MDDVLTYYSGSIYRPSCQLGLLLLLGLGLLLTVYTVGLIVPGILYKI